MNNTDGTLNVAERLEKQLPDSELLCTVAYDYKETLTDLLERLESEKECAFNLTGGTKIMVLAGYAAAIQKKSVILYYRSEGHRNILYSLEFEKGSVVKSQKQIVPAMINGTPLLDCDAFLKAYLGYYIQDNNPDSNDKLFERAIFKALSRDKNLEILQNIRPAGEKQIEIDLVIRRGLQFAIAEIKSGSIKGDTVKKGIDQLSTAGSREYMGTYTTKILILGRSVRSMCGDREHEVRDLALAKRVHIIEIKDYHSEKDYLTLDQAEFVRQQINEKLK